jgi:serine/threonine-protein kinase RsbW
MSAAGERFHLRLENNLAHIEPVETRVAGALQRLGFDVERAEHVGLAVREALANAIIHGNRKSPDKRVEVDFAVEPEEVVIRVQDQGPGFDPARLPDPLRPENLLKPNGRGILLMRTFMDRVEFAHIPQRGMRVTLRIGRVAPTARGARGMEAGQ